MEIQDIKSQLTIRMVLDHYNIKPDASLNSGRATAMINCPFHDDKTPSMQVYDKTNTAFCFSANCRLHGKSIDVIDFVKYKEFDMLSAAEAKHAALKKCTELLQQLSPNLSLSSVQSVPSVTTNIPALNRIELLQKLFTQFKTSVISSPTAKTYLKSRNLDYKKIEVGYNAGQFHHGARKDEQLIEDCIKYGLLSAYITENRTTEKKAYKVFGKDCICFALKNNKNEIVSFYFRSSQNVISSAVEMRHFYLKDRQGLYPCYPSRGTKKLILTESIIDAATLLQIPEITSEYSILACYGTNGLTEEHINVIKLLSNLSEIVFAFDNDDAGNKATTKYTKQLNTSHPNISISKLSLPCKDINETLIAHAPEVFTQLLNERTILFSSEEQKNTSNEKKNSETIKTPEIYTKPVEVPIKSISKNLDTKNINKIIYITDTAKYYILGGLSKQLDNMKVMLSVENERGFKSRNKIDLYEDKQVEKLSKDISEKLLLNENMLEQDLYTLTELLEQYREKNQIAEQTETSQIAIYQMNAEEKNKALNLAKDSNLIKIISQKLMQTGIIGEVENKTFLYIIAASHIQENPLNALVQGSSGSGKTNLLKGIYKTMPEESKKIYSRCSEKMLYNVPKYYFKNKLVCFEDVDGLGEEAQYAWRELVSNGQLTSGVSYKDDKGNIGIKELAVYGPITSIACTTKGAIYADNMSRLFLIAIDESKVQTHKINDYQAREAAGLINKTDQQKAIQQLQNFARLLQAYKVYNPFAIQLKLPEGIQDERRLYKLYLHFIEIITVLHQYQRLQTIDKKLITTVQDCQIAKDLMFECIMLKMDELDGSLRQFFERLKDYANKKSPQNPTNYEFTQKEIREQLHIKKTQLSYYINELMSLEYIQQTSSHINKGNKYKVLHFDNYRKTRQEVKDFLQNQIDKLQEHKVNTKANT
jgi:DNA primase